MISLVASNEAVRVDGLLIENKNFAQKLLELSPSEAQDFLNLCLSAGRHVMQFAETQGQADWLRRNVQDWFEVFGKDFEKSVIERAIQTLQDKMTESFGPERFNEFKDEFFRELSEVKSDVLGQQQQEELERLLAEKTPAKGLSFERDVLQDLEKLARARFDHVEAVGNFPGIGTSKKGDLLYVCGLTRGRIVFELKNYETDLSAQKIRSLMADSIENRGAQFGIFLVRDGACLPDHFGSFFLDGNMIVTTEANLEVALKIALFEIYRISHSRIRTDLDIQSVCEEVRQSIEAIKNMDRAQVGFKPIQKNLQKLSDEFQNVRNEVAARLSKVLGQIDSSTEQKENVP